jgi:hypothetical protein
MDAGTTQCGMTVEADGTVIFFRNSLANVLVRTNKSLRFNTYQYVELKTTIGDSVAGSIYMRLNGATWWDLTAVDTQHTANTFMTAVRFGLADTFYLDDVYICSTSGTANNDFLGDVRVEALFPNGAGNYSQFTPVNASPNYACVDETNPNDETDYVESASAGDKDSYTYTNLTAGTGTVLGVCPKMRVRKTDAGTREIRALARLSGSDAVGVTKALSTDWTTEQDVLETKPGGGAWGIADVNSAEFGVELVT